MIKTLLLVAAFHYIGAIITLIIDYKNGTLEYAAIYGDGIREAKPSYIIFADLILWEFCLLLYIAFEIEERIDNYFRRKYE